MGCERGLTDGLIAVLATAINRCLIWDVHAAYFNKTKQNKTKQNKSTKRK
jgi:hypothetical protein